LTVKDLQAALIKLRNIRLYKCHYLLYTDTSKLTHNQLNKQQNLYYYKLSLISNVLSKKLSKSVKDNIKNIISKDLYNFFNKYINYTVSNNSADMRLISSSEKNEADDFFLIMLI
jgi:hypothetical protein